MNKIQFFPLLGLIAALVFGSASTAIGGEYASMDDGWQGWYHKSSLKSLADGTIKMSDSNKGGPATFDECKDFPDGFEGKGWYCRLNGSSLNGSSDDSTPVADNGNDGSNDVYNIDLSGATKFAVFHSTKYYTNGKNFARLNNGTSSDVGFALKKCDQAGAFCVIVAADTPTKALRIVKAKYPSWPLGKTVN